MAECGVTEEMYSRLQAELAACQTELSAALWTMREQSQIKDVLNDKCDRAEARLDAIREALA